MNASTLRNLSVDELANYIETSDAINNPFVVALLDVVRFDWETDELLHEKDQEIEEHLADMETLEITISELEDEIAELNYSLDECKDELEEARA